MDGHELIVVQNGFSVKDFLRTALDGVYCPEGSSEPSLKKIITKKTWLIARETPEDAKPSNDTHTHTHLSTSTPTTTYIFFLFAVRYLMETT